MKRLFSIIIVGIMFLTLGTTAYAETMPFALGSAVRESILMISEDTATCTSKYNAVDDAVSEVIITQSLEKHCYLWVRETVGGEWSTTSDRSSVSFTNKVSELDSGTYRVKTVFNVTGTKGETEEITLYSAEKLKATKSRTVGSGTFDIWSY